MGMMQADQPVRYRFLIQPRQEWLVSLSQHLDPKVWSFPPSAARPIGAEAGRALHRPVRTLPGKCPIRAEVLDRWRKLGREMRGDQPAQASMPIAAANQFVAIFQDSSSRQSHLEDWGHPSSRQLTTKPGFWVVMATIRFS